MGLELSKSWLAALHSTHSATEAQLIDNSWNFLSTVHCPQQAAPSILLPSVHVGADWLIHWLYTTSVHVNADWLIHWVYFF